MLKNGTCEIRCFTQVGFEVEYRCMLPVYLYTMYHILYACILGEKQTLTVKLAEAKINEQKWAC